MAAAVVAVAEDVSTDLAANSAMIAVVAVAVVAADAVVEPVVADATSVANTSTKQKS